MNVFVLLNTKEDILKNDDRIFIFGWTIPLKVSVTVFVFQDGWMRLIEHTLKHTLLLSLFIHRCLLWMFGSGAGQKFGWDETLLQEEHDSL